MSKSLFFLAFVTLTIAVSSQQIPTEALSSSSNLTSQSSLENLSEGEISYGEEEYAFAENELSQEEEYLLAGENEEWMLTGENQEWTFNGEDGELNFNSEDIFSN